MGEEVAVTELNVVEEDSCVVDAPVVLVVVD